VSSIAERVEIHSTVCVE